MKNNALLLLILIILLANTAPIFRQPLFYSISLIDIIVLATLVWLMNFLPSPLREILMLILILWLLSALGVFAFIGFFTNLLLVAIVIVILFSII